MTPPLGPIGDMGEATLTELIGTSKITWETEADWDNAVVDDRARHPSATLLAGVGLDDFKDLTDGNSLPTPYDSTNLQASTSRSYTGSVSARTTGTGGGLPSFPTAITEDGATWQFLYNEDSSQNGFSLTPRNASGQIITYLGSNNPQVTVDDGDGNQELVSSPSPDYDTWRRFTITLDFTNDQYDLLWEDVGGSTADQTLTGRSFANSASEVSEWRVTDAPWGGPASATWLDLVEGVYYDASLTTATKSLTQSGQPDLVDLSYSLGSGEISLTAIGSPGTASEESVTQVLDGASSYTLSWTDSHTDFRVKVDITALARNTSPSLESVSLEG
jgi:hypothetical protein